MIFELDSTGSLYWGSSDILLEGLLLLEDASQGQCLPREVFSERRTPQGNFRSQKTKKKVINQFDGNQVEAS